MEDFHFEHGGQRYVTSANSRDEAVAKFKSKVLNRAQPRSTIESTLESISDMPRSAIRGAMVTAPPEIAAVGDAIAAGAETLPAESFSGDPYSGAAPPQPVEPMAPRLREAINARTPGLQMEPIGPFGRTAEQVGRAATWGAATLPITAAIPGALTAPALMGEAIALTAGPAMGQISREMGAPPGVAMATEIGASVASPMFAMRTVGGVTGRQAAKEAIATGTGKTVSRARARKVAKMLQAEYGTKATREKSAKVLKEGLKEFGKKDAPIPAQLLGGANVEGSRVLNRTRQLMSGDLKFSGEASARARRAQGVVQREATDLRPTAAGDDFVTGYADLAERRMAAAKKAFKELPPSEREIPLAPVRQALDDITNSGTSAQRRAAKKHLGEVTETIDDLEIRFPGGMVPDEEIDDILSVLMEIGRDKSTKGQWVAGKLQGKLRQLYDQGVERSAAGAKWREVKQTFEPQQPRRVTERNYSEKAARYSASKVAEQASSVAKRLIKPVGKGATPKSVVAQIKKTIAGDPDLTEALKGAYFDEIMGTGEDLISPVALTRRLSNTRVRGPFVDLFGSSEWGKYVKLAKMHRQSAFGDLDKASYAFKTGSETTSSLVSEIMQTARGQLDASIRLSSRLLKGRFSDTQVARIYRQAYRDSELAEALLSINNLDPEAWRRNVAQIAAKRGIVAPDKELAP